MNTQESLMFVRNYIGRIKRLDEVVTSSRNTKSGFEIHHEISIIQELSIAATFLSSTRASNLTYGQPQKELFSPIHSKRNPLPLSNSANLQIQNDQLKKNSLSSQKLTNTLKKDHLECYSP